jgi:hypothetical protein
MAKISFKKGDEYALKLSKLGAASSGIAKKAIYEGAGIVAEGIKNSIQQIPKDRFRFLKEEETFSGISNDQREDLNKGFGITPISADKNGDWNARIGFDGYGSKPTKKYPKGVPNLLLARAIESGSSVRSKYPFVRKAVNATKKNAIDAMARVIDEESEKIFKG